MPWKPSQVHIPGLLLTVLAAVILLLTLIPYAARTLFTPPLRGYNGLRFELFYYLAIALIPVALWLVPAFVRQLAAQLTARTGSSSADPGSTCDSPLRHRHSFGRLY